MKVLTVFAALPRQLAATARAILALTLALPAAGQAPPAAATAFSTYTRTVEARLAQQHRSASSFLAPADSNPQGGESRLRQGQTIVERVTEPADGGGDLSGALLHHWRGTAFVPGASAAGFERLLRNFNAYPRVFAPEVLDASVLSSHGDHLQARMRVRQQHVIAVVLDSTYDVTFSSLDPRHRSSVSRSSRIDEIEAYGTPSEHALGPDEEHGFLWRLNTYWTYEERDGGLYLQIEAVSLTRAIPVGLGFLIRPYINSIPRESLEFTLRSASQTLRR